MVVFGRCRKGSRDGEKLVTIPKACDIEPGELLVMKKVEMDKFDDIFKEGKNGKRK